MKNCVFCKIVAGKIPAYKIYEDENFLAFLDIAPFTEGHTLVIPKKHYHWVWDVPNIGRYFEVCQKIANHYKKVFKINLIISLIFGEQVPHAHIQLLPDIDNCRNKFSERLAGLRLPQLTPEKAEKLVQKLRLE